MLCLNPTDRVARVGGGSGSLRAVVAVSPFITKRGMIGLAAERLTLAVVEEGLEGGETVTEGRSRSLKVPGVLARALLDGGVKLGSGRKRGEEFSSVLDGLSRSTYGAVCRGRGTPRP